MSSAQISKLKLLLVLLSLTSIAAGLYFALYSLLTPIGAFSLILVLFLLLIRLLSYTILFPGSNTFWSRSLQSTFCSQLCFQGIRKVSSIKDFLTSLNQPEVHMNYATLKSASNFIKQVLLIYSKIALSSKQTQLNNLLKSLKSSMAELMIQDKNKKRVSVWTVLEHPEKVRKTHKLETISDAAEAIEMCDEIIKLLDEYIKVSIKKILFGGDFILGDLAYQRADFFSRFKAEEIFLKGNDGVQFDCAFIRPEEVRKENVAVVYCCPNGGYFEYIYYQTDWIEFYLQLNLPLFLWNYRGYGTSLGKPTSDNLIKDGIKLVEYVKEVRGYNKIILHGESLGGALASSIASINNVDILIADRTFSNIFDVFASYIGSFLAYIAIIVGPENIDCKKHFFEFPNTKILTCDIKDEVIPVQASLKVSLIHNFHSNFSKISVKNFENSLKVLKKYKKKYIKPTQNPKKSLFSPSSGHNYCSLFSDEHELTIEHFLNCFLALAEKIDAAGQGLVDIIENGSGEEWLKALEVWGSSSLTYGGEFYDLKSAAVERLRSFLEGSSRLVHEFEAVKEIELLNVVKAAGQVEQILATALSNLENRNLVDRRNGLLIILKCGHCGSFDTVEKYVLEKLISRNLTTE